jgi:DUF4097 and DUF4098 domain-containing protein YvlB
MGIKTMNSTSLTCSRLVAVGLLWTGLHASVGLCKDRVREELHETRPLATAGRVRLDNANGNIHIAGRDRAEVQVNAVKSGETQADVDGVKIEIDSKPDAIRIRTKFPSSKGKTNSTSVDYEIRVPAQAYLESIKAVNGSVHIEAVRGNVHASSVNGNLQLKGLAANAELSSVNGAVEAAFAKLDGRQAVSLKSVNGATEMTLPRNYDAEFSARTVNGGIEAISDLRIKKKWPVGQELSGKVGQGSAKVKAETVNGSIRVHRPEG